MTHFFPKLNVPVVQLPFHRAYAGQMGQSRGLPDGRVRRRAPGMFVFGKRLSDFKTPGNAAKGGPNRSTALFCGG